MNMKRLVLLSFCTKFCIAVFFIALVWVHYLISQALFQREATFNTVARELEEGANVNACTTGSVFGELNGLTPLMRAVMWCNLDRVKLLLKYKADVNLQAKAVPGDPVNRAGNTALHMAVKGANVPYDFDNAIAIIKELLAAGANPNAKNNYGETPLYTTLDIEGFIYDKDDNPLKDEEGDPIRNARRREVAELLIESGSDINAQANDGNTHLHYALYRGMWPWVIWFMKTYGSQINPKLKGKEEFSGKEYTIEELANRLRAQAERDSLIDAVEKGLRYVEQQ